MAHDFWTILIVEDDDDDFLLTRAMLDDARKSRFFLDRASSYETGFQKFCTEDYDIALLDYDLGAHSGLELLRRVRECGVNTPVVLLTGRGSYEVDVEAMQAGAMDYLNKGEATPALLERAIRYAIERANAEEALRNSRQQFAEILTSIKDGFLALDANWRLVYINETAAQNGSRDPEDLIGKDFWEEFPTLKDSPSWDLYHRVMTTRQPEHIEMSSGMRIWFQVSVYPTDQGISVYWRDITKEKQAALEREKLLAENSRQRELLEQVITSAPVGIAILSVPELVYIAANPYYHKQLGVQKDLIGLQFGSVWPELAEYMREIFDQVINSGQPFTTVDAPFTFLDKERQTEVYFTFSVTPLYGSQGDVDRMMIMTTDTSDEVKFRREREKETARLMEVEQDLREQAAELERRNRLLQENENLFRMTLSSAPIVVFTMDRDLRYTWMENPQGITDIAQVLGHTDDEAFGADAAQEITSMKRWVIENGQGMRREIEMRSAGGISRYDMMLEPIFDENKQVTGLTGVSVDVTLLRQLEARQKETATQIEMQHLLLESREKERQQIARDLHDGPVQEVIGLILMLKAVSTTLVDGELKAELEDLIAAAQKLSDSLRDVCNELRPPVLTQFGLSKAIQSHAADFSHRHPELTIDLVLDDDRHRLPDNTRLALFRIYQECLNNIMRHSEATHIDVRLTLKPADVVLEVQDNGVGFEASGEKWVNLARSGHLGLVGMKERAEAAGGRLDVISTTGAGTCIQAQIPLSA